MLGVWAALLILVAAPVHAEDEEKVRVRGKVTEVSDEGDGVEPGAEDLIRALGKQNIRYESARVVREVKVELAPGDSKSVKIGNGRKAHLQLMQADEKGALVALDVEGGVKADVKLRRGKRPFVVDAGKVGDAKRVISIEAE